MKIDSFTQGKVAGKNEDYFGYDKMSFVIADGATDKSGRLYEGKTGGEIVSRVAVKEALGSELNGEELIKHVNQKVWEQYEKFEIVSDVEDPKFRFTCGLIVVRLVGSKVVVTSVGDLGFRINGEFVFRGEKAVDRLATEARVSYIKETGDVTGSREKIMPLLIKQFEYQNKVEDELGYGVIDGTVTPGKFVDTFEYAQDEVKIIELFTDGYFDEPEKVSIEAWEEMYKRIEAEDPDKWKKYYSTKSKDDRTVAIVRF